MADAEPSEEEVTHSAIEQAKLIRTRAISSAELVTQHLERIAAVSPRINAVTEMLSDSAIAEAGAADAALARGEAVGPLHGVPFSIKDSIEVAGTVCTAGTVGRKDGAPSTEDATLVARLRSAGAIPIAKTNLPDLLFAFESDNLLFGRTNNPYDLTRTAGGSSGGEAALIASGGSPMGLGSDCAGSVRLPAAFCGIAGIKPTTGRLARTGHIPPSGGWIAPLWQIGPMARSVADLRLMMRVMSGADGRDPTAVAVPYVEFGEQPLRIAFHTDGADAEVTHVVRRAATALGAIEGRPACLADAYDLEMKLIGADGGDSLRAYLASIGSHTVHPLLTGWLDKLEAYRTDLAGFQTYWSEWDAYRHTVAEFFREYDVLLCPAYARAALLHGTSTQDANFRAFSHTMAWNLAGAPAAVVRCGESAEGLPIAVQIVARPWEDDLALLVAQRLEEEFGGWKAPTSL